MTLNLNEHGVPQHKKGDVRRWLVLLAAIDTLETPTLVQLSKYTGHNKGTIPADIEKIKEQLSVVITKTGAKYRIDDWGPVLKKGGVKKHLKG